MPASSSSIHLAFPDLEASARLLTHAFTRETVPGQRLPALVLDLGDVAAPTAGGLGQLVALHHRLRASGGRLILCNVGPTAYEVFEATRLTELFDVRRAGRLRPAADPEAAANDPALGAMAAKV